MSPYFNRTRDGERRADDGNGALRAHILRALPPHALLRLRCITTRGARPLLLLDTEDLQHYALCAHDTLPRLTLRVSNGWRFGNI